MRGVRIDGPRKQRTEGVDHPPWLLRQHFQQALERLVLTIAQMRNAFVQTVKTFIVRGHHQHVVRNVLLQPIERRHPLAHRVGGGLHRVHRHVGRNARQHLVARDQQLLLRVVQAGMFWRMTAPDHHLPIALADADFLAVREPLKAVRQRVDHLAECAETRTVFFERGVGPACFVEIIDRILGRFAVHVGDRHAAVQILKPRHPQPHAEAPREPARHAHMIGMHVGDEHARELAVERRRGKQLAPDLQRLFGARAGVHQRIAVAIFKQPDVDVIERHGHGLAQPVDALADFAPMAGCGRLHRVGKIGLRHV